MQKEIGVMLRLYRSTMVNDATKTPEDYVISTGEQYSVKDFVNIANFDMKLN